MNFNVDWFICYYWLFFDAPLRFAELFKELFFQSARLDARWRQSSVEIVSAEVERQEQTDESEPILYIYLFFSRTLSRE